MVKALSGTQEYKDFIAQTPVAIVDFYADWCGPCRMIAPVVESYEEELQKDEATSGKVAFAKVNVDEDTETAQTVGISAMPTFMVYKDGTLSKQIIGANIDGIKEAVQAALAPVADIAEAGETAEPVDPPAPAAPTE